jgi:hypothetical protein
MQTHDVNSNDMLESPCKILLVIAEKKKKNTSHHKHGEGEGEGQTVPFCFWFI